MYREIAKRLGISFSVVSKHVTAAYRQHDVHSREELREKLRRTIAPAQRPRTAAADRW